MVALDALALALVLSGAGETVLLEFTAAWCGPCRSVAPTVERLAADGYPIRPVDVDREPQLARQYGITGVPCFVLLVDGREASRLMGAASYDRLVQMLSAARIRPAAGGRPSGDLGGRGPAATEPQGAPSGGNSSDARPAAGGGRLATLESGASNSANPARFQAQALAATVRLRVQDPRGESIGTGTVVDRHGNESLIITCGHIFRDSGGQASITVELFTGGSVRTARGQLIAYDLDSDVGFVSVIPGVDIEPVQIAPAGYAVDRGCPVFSVGCSRGDSPTVQASHITSIDKYLGPPNIEVAGQPLDGRSGGGLFSGDGFLVGICNAADPKDNEGIYAGLGTIHGQLDRIGQSALYRPRASAPQLASDSRREPNPPRDDSPPPSMPPQMPPPAAVAAVLSPGDRALADDDTEVICIVRSKSRPQGNERLLILSQPSADLIERLNRESRPLDERAAAIALQPEREPRGPAAWPRTAPAADGASLRAQSPDP